MIVLGFDVGLRTAGWSMVEDFPVTAKYFPRFVPQILGAGFFVPVPRPPSNLVGDEASITSQVEDAATALIERLDGIRTRNKHKVDLVAIEHYTVRPKMAAYPAWIEFMIAGWAASIGIPLDLIHPKEVREYMLGTAPKKTKANPNPRRPDRSKWATEEKILEVCKLETAPWAHLTEERQEHVIDATSVALAGAFRNS